MGVHLPEARARLEGGSWTRSSWESAQRTTVKYSRRLKQKAEVGGHLLIISWPAGGAIAHFKGTAGARHPARLESLKSSNHPKRNPRPPKKCSLGKLVIAHDISTLQRPPEPNYKGASQVTPLLPLLSPPLLQPCRDQPEQVVEEGKDGDRKTISQVIFLLVSRPRKASANGTGRI